MAGADTGESGVGELRLELSPHIRRRQGSTGILVMGLGLVAAVNEWRVHRPLWVPAVGLLLASSGLVFWILMCRDATVLDARGITTRRYARTRSCPWSEVARITTIHSTNTGRPVLLQVERTDGQKLRLGAPLNRGRSGGDDAFTAEAERITAYWRTVTGTAAEDGTV